MAPVTIQDQNCLGYSDIYLPVNGPLAVTVCFANSDDWSTLNTAANHGACCRVGPRWQVVC